MHALNLSKLFEVVLNYSCSHYTDTLSVLFKSWKGHILNYVSTFKRLLPTPKGPWLVHFSNPDLINNK